VAHEINNPLSSLSAEIQWLLERSKDKKLRKSLRFIDRVSKRIAFIVNNLLAFSRETAKKVKVPSQINSLLDKTLALMDSRFRLINIKIVKDFGDNLSEVSVNRGEISQVFMNLLLNSLDAMPNGGELTISTKLNKTMKSVRIIFRDTGCGIAREHLPKIFDPFFSTKPIGKGTGLGLSVTHGIIKSHRGSIRVTSRVERGTKVEINLPLSGESLER